MIEAYIRPAYQRFFVNPVAKRLANRYSPNTITLMAGITGILVLPALWIDIPFIAVILLLLSGYCDTLDGTIARQNQLTSLTGTVLDILTDRIVECAVIIGLFSFNPDHRSLLCLLMLSSILICVTSFLVVGVFTPNDSEKSFHYSPGLIERPEAFIFFIAMIIFSNYFSLLAFLFVVLVLLTAFLRIRQFFKFN